MVGKAVCDSCSPRVNIPGRGIKMQLSDLLGSSTFMCFFFFFLFALLGAKFEPQQ